MKKYITLLVVAICVMLLIVGCSKGDSDDNEKDSTPGVSMNTWDDNFPTNSNDDIQNDEFPSDEDITGNQVDNNNDNNNHSGNNSSDNNSGGNNSSGGSVTTTRPNSGSSETTTNALGITDDDMSKLENSNAEVYFSDNPNNKYIIKVVNKYGANPDNLIALVKVNAEFPSGLVLEFSGEKDSNGELVMTYAELKCVYNIDDSKNTIVKAGKNGVGNDGVSKAESTITFFLMKEYFIPQLPDLKANKRYD